LVASNQFDWRDEAGGCNLCGNSIIWRVLGSNFESWSWYQESKLG
jgi:hypothetical protein